MLERCADHGLEAQGSQSIAINGYRQKTQCRSHGRYDLLFDYMSHWSDGVNAQPGVLAQLRQKHRRSTNVSRLLCMRKAGKGRNIRGQMLSFAIVLLYVKGFSDSLNDPGTMCSLCDVSISEAK